MHMCISRNIHEHTHTQTYIFMCGLSKSFVRIYVDGHVVMRVFFNPFTPREAIKIERVVREYEKYSITEGEDKTSIKKTEGND